MAVFILGLVAIIILMEMMKTVLGLMTWTILGFTFLSFSAVANRRRFCPAVVPNCVDVPNKEKMPRGTEASKATD